MLHIKLWQMAKQNQWLALIIHLSAIWFLTCETLDYFYDKFFILSNMMKWKKLALSFYIFLTSSLLFFTNLSINFRDSTPPPRKSVSGYCPWNPNFIHYLPDFCAGSSKYNVYSYFIKSHLSFCPSNMMFASSLSS